MARSGDNLASQTGLEGLCVEHHVTLLIEDSTHLSSVLSSFAHNHMKPNYILMRPVRNSGFEVDLRVSQQHGAALDRVISSLAEQPGIRTAQVEHMIARSGVI